MDALASSGNPQSIFNGKDFTQWLFRLKVGLAAYKSDATICEEIKPIDIQEAKAMEIIVNMLGNSILRVVSNCDTACEVIRTLKDTYMS